MDHRKQKNDKESSSRTKNLQTFIADLLFTTFSFCSVSL